jgi:hypothetical protein
MANGTLKVSNIQTSSGSGTITLGQSGETISIPSGCTITNSGTQTGFGGANTPAFSAKMSGTQTISHNTSTKVTFDTEVFDTDSAYDHSTNYRFTPQTAGKYSVSHMLYLDGQGQGNLRIFSARIHKNGSLVGISGDDKGSGYQNNGVESLTITVEMNGSSDYLEAYVYQFTQDSSSSPAGGSDAYSALFTAHKLIT